VGRGSPADGTLNDGGSLGAIGRLRAVVARLGELEDGGGEAGRWFAARVAIYDVAGGRIAADVAFGLAPGPGCEGWWRIEARSRRDALLCEIARRFYVDEPSERRQAELIARRLARFHSGARLWRTGAIEELLHYVTAIGLATSARTVQRALAAGRLCQTLPAFSGTPVGLSRRHESPTKTAAADF
jgi:hypothetical protein